MMPLNFKLIGLRVTQARTSQHMTQLELAERIERSVPYISQIETATKHASLESLASIGEVLGVTVDFLLNGDQVNDILEDQTNMAQLFNGCNSYEKRVIFQMAAATKKILLENKASFTID